MTVQNSYIIVERYDKVDKTTKFQSITINNNMGRIIESGDDDWKEGEIIYFLKDFERVMMDGKEVLVMKHENILKLVEGENDSDS